VELAGSENKIHIRETLFYIFDDVLLFNHTAADTDTQILVFAFVMLELARAGKRFKLRVFAYRAGVHDYNGTFGQPAFFGELPAFLRYIRRHIRVYYLITHSVKQPFYFF
jgi:hypothetical protein